MSESEDDVEVEVLFEYSGSRTAIKTPLSTLVEAFETQLLKLGVAALVAYEPGVVKDDVMLIQRFDKKWLNFLN